MIPSTAIQTSQQLGAYVRALRKARGLTQTDVARMLGVSKMRVATIEKDIGRVSTASVIELVHLLGGSILLDIPELPARFAAKSPLQHASESGVRARRSRGEW